MSRVRRFARIVAVPAAVVIVGVIAAAPAYAHVTISVTDSHAGAFTVATVSVPHGCDGAATTKIAVKIPEQILSVTPTRNPFWNVEKVMVGLNPPATDAHGNEVTERVDQIVYTAKQPLPEGQRDAFQLSFQMPDAAGETLFFPTVQDCVKGQTAWVEEPVEGGEEPEHPAPAITVLAAAEEGEEPAAPEGTTASTDDNNGLAWAGLGVGALGVVLGGTALARGRKDA